MATQATLVERLRAVMERQGVNARELAGQSGVGPSFVYDILSGRSQNPTTQKLAAVAQTLGVSVHYLLHGMDGTDGVAQASASSSLVAIAPLAVEVTAAGITVVTPQGYSTPYRVHRAWLEEELGIPVWQLRMLQALDDSMAPTLQEGDTVLVNIADVPEVPDGLFAIVDRLGITLRRISAAEPGALLVATDNPAFRSQERPAADIHILGRVVWVAHTFV